MKLLLIALLALGLSACATSNPKGLDKQLHDINLKLDIIIEQRTFYKMAPNECFEDGVFDENLGTDTIDCGNIQ